MHKFPNLALDGSDMCRVTDLIYQSDTEQVRIMINPSLHLYRNGICLHLLDL